jgi:hypothetical protein
VKVCVDKLTDAVLRLPLKVYERNSQNEKQRVVERAARRRDPHPARAAAAELKQWLIKPQLIHGTVGAADRRGAGGPPIGLREARLAVKLEPRTIGDDDRDRLLALPPQPNGKPEVCSPRTCCSIEWDDPPRGAIGSRRCEPLAITLMIEHAAQQYQEHFRNASARPAASTCQDNDLAKDPSSGAFEQELERLSAASRTPASRS